MNHLYVALLTCFSLVFTGCTATSGSQREPVPVEDRTVTKKTTSPENNQTQNDSMPEVETRTAPKTSERVNETTVTNTERGVVQTDKASPVALAFIEDADKQSQAGDSARAIASLERGLDIEPKNPWLWNRLASERLKQGFWEKAITLAKKSNTYAATNYQLQKDNWLIIAHAKNALGDTEGTREANEMAERFSTKQS